MQRSESIDQLATALAKAQGMMDKADKDAKGNFGKYATLAAIWDAIREPLSCNGLSVVQTTSRDDGGAILETTLMHVSGQWVQSSVPILTRDGSPQQFGSGLTYARRYGLGPIAGIAADDDDGEAAQRGFQQQAQRPQPAQQPATAAPKPNGNGHAPEPTATQMFDEMTTADTERAALAIKARIVGNIRPDEAKAHPDMRAKFKQNLAIAVGSSEERHALTAFLFGSDVAEEWTQGQLMAANTWLGVGKAGDGYAPSAKFLDDWKIIKAAIMPAAEVARPHTD